MIFKTPVKTTITIIVANAHEFIEVKLWLEEHVGSTDYYMVSRGGNIDTPPLADLAIIYLVKFSENVSNEITTLFALRFTLA